MKSMKKYIVGLAFMIMMGFVNLGNTQAIYKIQNDKVVTMKIEGTSTLKSWEMDAKSATGKAQFVFKTGSDRELQSVKSVEFNLEVKELQSDNNKLDQHAYKALKADEFKEIRYKLSSSTLSPEKVGFLLKTRGKLTIAGITKDIAMDIHISVNENNTIVSKGEYKLNMTDYDVEPPSFMLGLMNTGDAVTLSFEVIFIKQIEG
jgi:polyisoprenoid-binding protein YceI